MTLQSRITRLEAQPGANFLTEGEREAAINRYADTHRAIGNAFPSAMNPAAYRSAIETIRNPAQQRLLACMLPGDDDI